MDNVSQIKTKYFDYKNEVTYRKYECPKSKFKWHKTFGWKYDFQKIISITFNKSLIYRDLKLESAVHKTNAFDHWAMMIYNQVDRFKAISHNIY